MLFQNDTILLRELFTYDFARQEVVAVTSIHEYKSVLACNMITYGDKFEIFMISESQMV